MDNLDDSENNAKVSDSAYSNSCSNSQSRRSHSSKSTHSGSHSSGSSGYGGKPSPSGSSKTLINQQPEKIIKDKDAKKKKQQLQTELVQIPADVEFRLPDPAPVNAVEVELENASTPPVPEQAQNGVQRCSEATKEDVAEKSDHCAAPQQSTHVLISKPSYSEGFSCVISMHDGVVMYMSATLTAALGFPKDMWLGRSFIDFVHPLDHNTFASQITNGLAVPKDGNGMQNAVKSPGNSVSTMFCRIRRCRTLSTGFGVKDRSVTFMPFMLKLSFKNVYEEKGSVIYLVIQATPLFSAYNSPNEVIEDTVQFVMRHVANGNVEYIDNEAVPLLGYLPQDVVGRDALRLYHPEDLPYMRHVYETVVKQGRVPRSKPYRMLAQNGNYLKLETEWSSFINPWSRKLEFVVGKHHVIEGPENPDVFQAPPTTLKNTEENTNEIEGLRASIVRILYEVPTRPAEVVRQMTKRCQDLASFMESLIEDQSKVEDELRLEIQENDNSYYGPENPDVFQAPPTTLKNTEENTNEIEGLRASIVRILYEVPTRPAEVVRQMTKRCQDLASFMESLIEDQSKVEDELRLEIQENDNSYYERDSVMLGGISPHHDYNDSKSSTGTNLSYNQLNYNVNIKRYFDSRQDTLEEETSKVTETTHVLNKGQNMFSRECMSPMAHYSGDAVMATVEPACLACTESSVEQPHEYQTIRLTESILTKHNSEMEKIFVKKHRESRPAKKEEREKLCNESKQKKRDHLVRCNASFVSTTGASVVMDTQPHGLKRASKPQETEAGTHKQHCATSRQMRRRQPSGSFAAPAPPSAVATVPTKPPVWGQNYVSGPELRSQQMPLVSPITAVPGFLPMYYLPPAAPTLPGSPEAVLAHDPAKQFQTPAVHFMMYGQAVFGSPIVVSPINHQAPFAMQQNVMQNHFSTTQNTLRPPTSNYEERNEAVPESSASRDSKMKSDETVDRTDGESCYSSFYSSFFKTESGSAGESDDAKNKQNKTGSSGEPTVPGKDNQRNNQMLIRKMDSPWIEKVCVTSELIYKYQVLTKSLDEVLVTDQKKMAKFEQPSMVREQLGQLYMDLQLEGVAARLTLEEGITSSGSSSEDGQKRPVDASAKRARRKRKYSKLVMIYEEDAPLPPPEDEPEPEPSTSVA